jgi:predicted alpha/beta hydrolase family esterase
MLWPHSAVDLLAMWIEDRRRRASVPFVPAPCRPLDCFGPLPGIPPPPQARSWEAPSPRPTPGDARMQVEVTPAVGARRGTAVLVPPWKLPRLSLLSRWTAALARSGNEVWTLIPPLHLGRSPPGLRSGEAFVTADVGALRAALEQLVLEVRVLVALARARSQPVGLIGLSLGALAAALAATAPEAPDRAAVIAPPADPGAVVATRIGRRLLGGGRAADRPRPEEAELPAMLRPFRPDGRPAPAGKVLVSVGSADRIALPAAAAELARSWGAELRVYPRGHITLLFLCKAARRDAVAFLSPSHP